MGEAGEVSEFERHWNRFTRSLGPIRDLLRREIAESGASAQAITEAQLDADESPDRDQSEAGFVEARAAVGQRVLLAPLGEWERRQPLRRALLAFESYHRALDDQIRRAPERVQVRGEELDAVLRPLTGDVPFLRIWGRSSKPRSIPFRDLIHHGLHSADGDQLLLQRRFSFALARSLQDLVSRWRLRQHEFDAGVNHPGHGNGDVGNGASSAISTPEQLASHTRAALDEWDRLAEALLEAVARRIVAGILWPRKVAPPGKRVALRGQIEHWMVMLNSIELELRFERDLFSVEQRLLELGLEGCDSIEAERHMLLDRMDAMSAWLSDRLPEAGVPDAPPVEVPDVAPASSRFGELHSRARGTMGSLPAELRLLKRLEASTGRSLVWRELKPAELAIETFDEVGRPELDAFFSKAQTEHVALARRIDQALQVVEYGTRSQEGTGSAEDASVAHEALENALGLLETEKDSVVPTLEHEKKLVVAALAQYFTEFRSILQRTRLGALARIGALGLRPVLADGIRGALRSLLLWARFAGRGLIWLYRRFLIAIQWIPPEEPDAIEVVRRPYLPSEFTVDLDDREIPSIYRRLFRLEAVQDPRFLIGRDEELAAITEARALWENGRPVALLIVGTRGSGKTSLINCALSRSLAGLEILRGEFNERVLDPSSLREALVETFGLSDPDNLESELSARHSVVVLEEVERTFLREIGGFGAIRELQRLIAATCRTTLWVVACNQRAFSLLDRAVKLGDGFSHRIDTASVSGESLRQAILVRHNLSGLGLRFLPPPRSAVSKVFRRVGIRREADPEQTFFQRLADESSGVFRTAFELWLGQIDSFHSSVLRVNPILAPEIEAIIADLDQEDLFTLLTVMQHGSLTADEHARVFQQSRAASRAEMDELLGRELIELDPLRPGFRIRPSAMRLTREALHRRNLG